MTTHASALWRLDYGYYRKQHKPSARTATLCAAKSRLHEDTVTYGYNGIRQHESSTSWTLCSMFNNTKVQDQPHSSNTAPQAFLLHGQESVNLRWLPKAVALATRMLGILGEGKILSKLRRRHCGVLSSPCTIALLLVCAIATVHPFRLFHVDNILGPVQNSYTPKMTILEHSSSSPTLKQLPVQAGVD